MLRTALFVLLLAILGATPAFAASSTGSISGLVVDSLTGIPLAAVSVKTVGGTEATTTTDAFGHFRLENLIPGTYNLRIEKTGYQLTLSDQIGVYPGGEQHVTLAMQRISTGAAGMRTIGRTVITAAGALQRSSIIAKQQNAEVLQQQGIFRTGDYLRSVPAVNQNVSTGGTDTPSPGDDIYLDIRGVGGLESIALMNGHPIGYGIVRGRNVGYNWEISPTFALRTVELTFGSGTAGLTPYSAVGGVADMLTLEPTPRTEWSFTQGYGTYSKLVTSFNATGTAGEMGFAVALGTQGLDGPYKSQYFYQPLAAFDPSAPQNTPEYQSGIYKDDTSVVNRGDYAKIRFPIGNSGTPARRGRISLSALSAYYWDDKTGNGDQDFLPYDTALATGNNLAASYTGPPNPNPLGVPNCGVGSGQFTAFNVNGNPWGYGINGLPDGGKSCVTAQQYASLISGLQGAGTTFQTFTMSDYALTYDQPVGTTQMQVNLYTNRWYQLYDRTFQLPFFAVPGDNPFYLNLQVNTTGESVTDRFYGQNNDIGLGFATNNYSYSFFQTGVPQPSPTIWDQAVYLQDVYHPSTTTWKAYLNLAEVYASITHTMVFNPRLAFVDELPHNNTLRLAAGEAAVQPYASYVDLPFSATAIGALPSFVNCTGLTSIGQAANPLLVPERANDQEFSFGHGFSGDSQVQLTLYNENMNSKIFATVVPVTSLPAGVIPASTITQFETAINSLCGTTGLSGVGVNVQNNVGRLLAQGLDLSGRARFNRKLFVDFDYAVESTTLRSADIVTLQNNLTLIEGAQLPGVPLHKAQIALDGTVGRGIDLRYTQYFVSANNSKNQPKYNYGEFTANIPLSPASSVNIGTTNVWNQFTGYNGQIGHGVPLPLNQYATVSNYQPLVGTAATELFGLPNSQIYISYTYHAR